MFLTFNQPSTLFLTGRVSFQDVNASRQTAVNIKVIKFELDDWYTSIITAIQIGLRRPKS
jgi:hypothetical protein